MRGFLTTSLTSTVDRPSLALILTLSSLSTTNLTRGHESTLRCPRAREQQRELASAIWSQKLLDRRRLYILEVDALGFILGNHQPYLEASPNDVS
jgi:hypothetical protein